MILSSSSRMKKSTIPVERRDSSVMLMMEDEDDDHDDHCSCLLTIVVVLLFLFCFLRTRRSRPNDPITRNNTCKKFSTSISISTFFIELLLLAVGVLVVTALFLRSVV